jgi:CRISPR-associated endonuclease/helicase Cas3
MSNSPSQNLDRLYAKTAEKTEKGTYKKTRRGTYHESIYLKSHLLSACRSAEYLWKKRGKAILRACGIYSRQLYRKIGRIIRAAAILHDIGKANSQFQRMLASIMEIIKDEVGRQILRHEWVSALIVSIPKIRETLTEYLGGDKEYQMFRSAIAGHHIKALVKDAPSFEEIDNKLKKEGYQREMEILLNHPEFPLIIDEISDRLGVAIPVPKLRMAQRCSNFLDAEHKWYKIFDNYRYEVKSICDSMTEQDHVEAAIVQSVVIMADVISSAFVDNRNPNGVSKSVPAWISRMFNVYPDPAVFEGIVKHKLKGNPPRPFQIRVKECQAHQMCIEASTGEGKTAAFCMWVPIAYPHTKLILMLPTISTSENMFREYFFDGEEKTSIGGADLFTSKYLSQISRLVENGQEDYTGNYEDRADRVASLRMATTPISVCTVDSMLGLMQNYTKSVYAFSEIVTSVLVFDEVHTYDDRLFSALLTFLKTFPNVPVVLMTATLKPSQRKALQECCPNMEMIKGDPEFSAAKKYTYLSGNEVDWSEFICDSYKKSEKGIVIRNTVRRAMSHYCDLVERHPDWDIRLTHSRFKEKDRFNALDQTVKAFKKDNPIILVSTQIVEVSFNISGLSMVSDACPIGSWLQRIGRLARRVHEAGKILVNSDIGNDEWVVYKTGNDGKEEVEKAITFFNELVHGRAYSTADFHKLWKKLSENDPPLLAAVECAFFNMLVGTKESLRNTSRTVDIILESDLKKAIATKKNGEEYYNPRIILEHSIRMDDIGGKITSDPTVEVKHFPTECGLYVIPDELVLYDEVLGASWASKANCAELYPRLRGIRR